MKKPESKVERNQYSVGRSVRRVMLTGLVFLLAMGFVLVACFAQESRMSGQTNARQQTGATDWKAVEQALDAAIEIALRTRPDLRLARLTEEVAQAGLRLARAQNAPEVTAFTRYSIHRSTFDNTPVGTLRDRDKLLTFGVSIGIPVFNRNQGAKAEAAAAISQAKARREFLEQVVRSEVTSAYARYEAARAALTTFEQGVIARSNENIRTIRAAYQLGAFRITDLLAEQRRLVDSQREFTEALAERYRALADRQVALGAPISPR